MGRMLSQKYPLNKYHFYIDLDGQKNDDNL